MPTDASPDHSAPERAYADWMAAQGNLIGALNPDWSDVVRANNGATRLTRELRRELGREIGRDLDGAGAAPLLPFP
ncbi:MAG: hypothetical protein AAGI13_11530, partial [Pseudomonadota bacterium]